MSRLLLPALLFAIALSGAPTVAVACPDCPTARTARASVFDHDFGRNLLTALAPFLVVGLVAASVHRAGSHRRPPPPDRTSTTPEGDAS